MVDLVPELRLIIGEQAPVPELPPQDAQRRFQLVFRRFLAVFARAGASAGPLPRRSAVARRGHARSARRPVDASGCAPRAADRRVPGQRGHGWPIRSCAPSIAIRSAGAAVHGDRPRTAHPRTRGPPGCGFALLLTRTPRRRWRNWCTRRPAGNPFFVIQFLSALVEEGLLTFDHGAARWSLGPGSHSCQGVHGQRGRPDGRTSCAPAPPARKRSCSSSPAWATARTLPRLAMVHEGSEEELRPRPAGRAANRTRYSMQTGPIDSCTTAFRKPPIR